MGITDRRLKDKRFIKTERAIMEALFSSKKILEVRIIIKKAKISRATLYRHHRTVYDIIPDYENYILRKYSRLMGGLMKRDNITIKVIYCQLLIFILKNKNIFRVIIDRGNMRIVEEMIKRIEPRIMTEYRLPKNCENVMNIYRKEASGVIEKWIKVGFIEKETVILADILYLTKTLKSRLLPLAR